MADENKTTDSQPEGNIVYIWKIPIDRDYIKSIPSILKVVGATLSFIAFICVASGRTEKCDDDYSSTYNYFEFVSMSSFLTLLIAWFFFALTIATRKMIRIVPWKFGYFIIFGIFGLLYLIADICLAAMDCGKDSNKAGAAFGFFAMFCIVGVAGIYGREWFVKRNAASAEARSSSDYNAERNMEQY